MKKKMLFLFILTTLIALIIAGCSGGTDTSSEETEGEEKNQETEQTTDTETESEETAEVKLPDEITMTAYDVGSAGYAQLTAISDAIAKEYGTQVRMIPSASGVGRLTPLKDGTAQIGGRLGDEVYFAFEGVEEFATQQWGPQDLTYIYPIASQYGFLVLEDSDIQSVEDLKGRKVPHIIGNSSNNRKIEGILASGGLTLDDVEMVEITDYSGQPTLMARGEIDVAAQTPSAASVYEAEELHDVRWLDLSHLKDQEALESLHEVYPFGFAQDWDSGAALTEGEPVTFMGFSTYAPAAYRDTDPDLIYNWLKAINSTFDIFSQVSDDLLLWHYEEAIVEPLGVPLHEGAVRFFKEKGMWTDEYEQKNNELLERQQKLQEAWETVIAEASEKGLSEKEFSEYWLERREELVN